MKLATLESTSVLTVPLAECRICASETSLVLDLGAMPPANWLTNDPSDVVHEFPLTLEQCVSCRNLQLSHCVDAGVLYSRYNYATPQSKALSRHYEELLMALRKHGAGDESFVVEVGSNVGLLLEFFKPHFQRVLGIDPAENIARIAQERGIDTIVDFFDASVAARLKQQGGPADVIVARHCMAHNADPYSLLDGVDSLLSANGILVIENAYALNTVLNNEFDQIYHEHMFYFSLSVINRMLRRYDMEAFDVQMSEVHGGSIAVFAARKAARYLKTQAVVDTLASEDDFFGSDAIRRFAASAFEIRDSLTRVVSNAVRSGKTIYAYGATAKGSTLLNFCGLTRESIPYCADSTPIKQGKFMPKSGTQIVSEEWAFQNPPDAFLLTAWNYKEELIEKVRRAGITCDFIMPIPNVLVTRS